MRGGGHDMYRQVFAAEKCVTYTMVELPVEEQLEQKESHYNTRRRRDKCSSVICCISVCINIDKLHFI